MGGQVPFIIIIDIHLRDERSGDWTDRGVLEEEQTKAFLSLAEHNGPFVFTEKIYT